MRAGLAAAEAAIAEVVAAFARRDKAPAPPALAKSTAISPPGAAPLAKRNSPPAGSGKFFVEFDTIAPGSGGAVIASGVASLDEPAKLLLPPAALHEMAGDAPAGEVVELRPLARGLFVRARISDRVAASKVREGIYKGIAFIVAADGRVERAALVDRPDALGKAARAPARSLEISLEKGTAMTRRSILIDEGEARRIEREARDRAEHEHRMAKAATHDFRKAADQNTALDQIRAALRATPIRPGFAYGYDERR